MALMSHHPWLAPVLQSITVRVNDQHHFFSSYWDFLSPLPEGEEALVAH